MATSDDFESLADQLKAISNPKRLRLLRFLAQPHYLEEIASELRTARQTAQEHVQLLLDAGLLRKVPGRRDSGRVADYVTVPQRVFAMMEEFAKVGGVEPEAGQETTRPMTQAVRTEMVLARNQDVPRLTIVHGLRLGRTAHLTGGGPWLVGRDVHAALELDYDPFVSARHCEVRRTGPGYEVADLYSSNGTFVDWSKVPRGGTAQLENGSVVRAGRSLLVFRRPGL